MSNISPVISSPSENYFQHDEFEGSELIQASLGRKSEDSYCFDSQGCTNTNVDMPLTTYVTASTSRSSTKETVFRIDPSQSHLVTPEKFIKVLLEDDRPEGVPVFRGVELVAKSKWLGWEGKRRIAYQETGPGSFLMFTISPRKYMVGVYIHEQSSRKVSIRWDLVNNYNSETDSFTGNWGDALVNQGITSTPNSVWTPYSTGEWILDLDQGLITYKVTSDPGGSVPNINFDGPALKFTNFIINDLLGLSGSAEIVN